MGWGTYRDAKVEIGVDISVEIDFALFGELHNGLSR